MEMDHAGAKHGRHGRYHRYHVVVVVIVCIFWFFLFFFSPSRMTTTTVDTGSIRPRSPCDGKYVYIHDLPSKFNSDMLRHCRTLSKWTDMCLFTTNSGFGPELEPSDVFPYSGWYYTNQFTLDVIFHNRMNHYKCLTNDSSRANAIFVPFYAGLDVARYLWDYNTSVRDSTSSELVRWLRSRPEWEVMGGRDHFVVAGRITWDFRRFNDDEPNWGNKFLLLPEVKNMTTLVLEASPWHSNDVGIPYPTYFHPKDGREVLRWQERMRGKKRKWLFSFAGAPRPNLTESIRGRIIKQCHSSRRCSLLDCDAEASKCHSPSSIMRLFQSSVFCLQPQGDSYTRRSAFDAMVAGCVPVFFHPGSAYVQYLWHLPRDYSRYSVFISEEEVREGNVRSIEEVLDGIEEEKVKAMREEVIQMTPRLVYADPRSKLLGMKDAFDLAVDRTIERVEGLRKEMRGAGEMRKFQEHNSWKYGLMANEEPHEWDHFFFKPSSRLI